MTVAVPAETAESVTVLPDTEALTTPIRLEPAVYVSRSPSGSVKYRATFTDAGPPPSVSVCAGTEPVARGGWLVVSPPGRASIRHRDVPAILLASNPLRFMALSEQIPP